MKFMKNGQVLEVLADYDRALDGLPKEKRNCSNLGAEALTEAIKDYETQKRRVMKS